MLDNCVIMMKIKSVSMVHTKYFQHSIWKGFSPKAELDSAAVSIFVVILVELTNTVFVNSTNITTNIETAVLSNQIS